MSRGTGKGSVTAIITSILVLLALIVLWNSLFVVREGQQVVVTKFGEVQRSITDAGLELKIPFIERVRTFEKRILEFDGDPNQILTADKKLIFVDTFARWQIDDPEKYLKKVQGIEAQAQARMDGIIDGATRTLVTQYPLIELVRNSDRPLSLDKEIAEARLQVREVDVALEDQEDGDGADPDLSESVGGREKIMKEILERAREEVTELGIRLVDVKLKRINYGNESAGRVEVRNRVFERMISARRQIAQKYRSEGQEKRQEWLGRIQQEKDQIASEAYKEVETIKGEADAEAARIYAEAYGEDPEFYAFYKSLELYRQSLSSNSTLVISTDSDLFHYLKRAGLATSGSTPSR